MFSKFEYITPPVNAGQVAFRFISTIITRQLARTSITPNQVTLSRMVVVTLSLYLFSLGDPFSLIWAVFLFYIFEILDHVDGDLARYKKQFSDLGPKLEQFVDTWSSRPSNVFGFCVALGMYNYTESISGFVLFGITALGRILWLEYRDVFGWVRMPKGTDNQYHEVVGKSFVSTVKNLFEILYIWNNTFLLLGALFFLPIRNILGINSLEIGFLIVAILNNIPWVVILIRGFSSSSDRD